MNTGFGEPVTLTPRSVESIVKALALEFVPPGPATVMGPVVAPAGTNAPSKLLFVTAKPAAGTPLNRTAVAFVKFAPVMVTFVPGKPCVGEKPVMLGGPLKMPLLVADPPGVVTVIGPEVTPEGTVAVISELLFTVKPAAATPLNVTAEAFVKLLPLI